MTLPDITVLAGKSTDMVPVVVIGLPDTVNVELETPTLVTAITGVVDTVTLPLLLLKLMPEPALSLVTPVLIILILPLLELIITI